MVQSGWCYLSHYLGQPQVLKVQPQDYPTGASLSSVFLPVRIKSFGGWQPSPVAEEDCRSQGQTEDVAVSHLFQNLSILLLRGNAALLLNIIPSFTEP
jgi:hypothetical protein